MAFIPKKLWGAIERHRGAIELFARALRHQPRALRHRPRALRHKLGRRKTSLECVYVEPMDVNYRDVPNVNTQTGSAGILHKH